MNHTTPKKTPFTTQLSPNSYQRPLVGWYYHQIIDGVKKYFGWTAETCGITVRPISRKVGAPGDCGRAFHCRAGSQRLGLSRREAFRCARCFVVRGVSLYEVFRCARRFVARGVSLCATGSLREALRGWRRFVLRERLGRIVVRRRFGGLFAQYAV